MTATQDNTAPIPDYGSDPIGDGTFRMVPSGDIVTFEERNRRLPLRAKPADDCFGKSWDEIERMQGGRLNRDV